MFPDIANTVVVQPAYFDHGDLFTVDDRFVVLHTLTTAN